MNENLVNIFKNKKKISKKYYYYNKYDREIRNRNFEEYKNSPFDIRCRINVKSHDQIYSLNQNKYGLFPNEVDLNFENNNTLLNDKNTKTYDDHITKEILFQNSKKSEKRTFKIIKCERIKSSNRNTKNKSIIKNNPLKNSNIFTKDNDKVNNNIIDKNRDNLNTNNKLILKKLQSQEFLDGHLLKNNSTSFTGKIRRIDNNFRNTNPRTNNNVFINKIIRRELSENNHQFNCTSNNTHKDIFNTTDKKDNDKEKNLFKRNKISDSKNKGKVIKKIIRNKNITSSKTTKENTMKNTLENTIKSEYGMNKNNRIKSDDDYNHNKTLDDKTNTIKDESKNKINDINIINNNFRYTEKEILYKKINNNRNGNKNIKTSKSKNKVINHINLNKNRNKRNFINKTEKNGDIIAISEKMNKYSSIRNITIEDINSKSFKNLSKSNDFSSYSNIKNNTSRENINNINYMSCIADSNILFTNSNINKTNEKKRSIEKIKIKKIIHLDKGDEEKNSKKADKMKKKFKKRTIIKYIYNNKPINANFILSKKNYTDFKVNNNILLKSDINQSRNQIDEKIKNISDLFCGISKDSANINDNINSTAEMIKELNEQGLSNIQVNSYESQFISNLNQNSNTLSCFNKSDIKLNNQINFDMPVNIDLEKIEMEESKEDTKNKTKIIKKDNKTKNDAIKVDIQQSNSKYEKLDNFINQLNDDGESDSDEEEEEEEKESQSEGEEKGEGEEPEEKIFIQNNKIVHYNSDLPTYGLSMAELKVSKNSISNTNDDNNNFQIDKNKNEKEKENNTNNINNENFNLYNFDLKSKENESDNKESNIKNNVNYEDLDITRSNKVNEVVKYDASYNEKRFNIVDMNIDSPHSDQDFLGNLELIQKNNINNNLHEKEMKKNNDMINNNNNNIKELESEYEFNLSKEKFYKPLNKYENAFNFDKINRFKS